MSLALGLGAGSASAATWQEVPVKWLGPPASERVLVGPYRVMRLDEARLAMLTDAAPPEFTDRSGAPVLDLPWPDGGTRRFAIEVSPVMEPGLAQKFPEIQTYRGRGVDDPTAVTRFDRTPAGFHAIVLSSEGTVYIDPWSPTDRRHYDRVPVPLRRLEPRVGRRSRPGAALRRGAAGSHVR
jgi:hypothetical protein